MRVVQVGLGPVGLELVRLATSRSALELVGAADPRPDLAGRDVGEILGGDATGVIVSADADLLLRSARPDIVIHATGSALDKVANQLRSAIASGASVVSTCEELAYPFHRHPALAHDLDAFAAGHGAVLLGTGVNPGFVMDKLVVTLLGACRSVRSVHVARVVDASRRREPLQRKIGAGLTAEEFDERARTGRAGHVGLAESAHMVGDAMGLSARRVLREALRPVLAPRRIATAYLTVEPGQVAGIEQSAALEIEGEERVRLDLEMSVGAERPVDSIVIDGSPRLATSIHEGLHGDEATASIVVNCAYLLRDLRPGLRTMLDVPLRGYELSGS